MITEDIRAAMKEPSAACECGRSPRRLVYVCEHCPRLAPEGKRIWRWLQGFAKEVSA